MAVKDHRVLVAGCGSIGKRHAACLYDIGIRQFVFFDPDPERSRELAAKYGGTTVAEYEEGLETDTDSVYLLSPTRLHIPQAVAAVEHGKHVFTEKPLSDSPDGAAELERLAAERGRTVAVGFCFRFHDGVRRLIKTVRSGEIGRTVSVRAMMGEHFPDVRPDYLSTYYVKYSGAFELVHDLDLAMYIAGAEPEEYHGICGSYSGLGFESPDTVELILRFPECSASVHLDFFQSPRTRTLSVLGTEGQAVLEFPSWDEYTLRTYSRKSREWKTETGKTERNDMFRAESENFFAAIEGREAVMCPISEAVRSLKVTYGVQNGCSPTAH